MTFYALSALINAILSTIFGAFVLYKNYKNKVNRIFGLMSAAVALWSYFYFFWQISDDYAFALLWTRLLSIGSLFIPVFYFHWVAVVLDLDRQKKKEIVCYYLIAVFFLLFSFSSYFVSDVEPILDFNFWPKAGILYSLYLVVVYIWLITYGIYLLIKHYKFTSGIKRAQILYILLGSVVGFSGGATNFPLWYGILVPPVGNILVSFYTVSLAYSVLRYRFMDIKLALRAGTVYISSAVVIIGIATISQYLFEEILLLPQFTAVIITLIICIGIFKYIEGYFYRVANKYFFTSLYDSKQIIRDLSESLGSTIETKKIYQAINKTIGSALHPRHLAILINGNVNRLSVDYAENINLDKTVSVSERTAKFFQKDTYSLVTEELQRQDAAKNKAVIEDLKRWHAAVAIPLKTTQKFIGLIILGNKETNDIYSREDIEILNVIGRQAAMAIDNGLLYNEVSNFNIVLKEKVNKATAELRAANTELKHLDEAKSEFISIASHQLRTPLTAIKGYGSMLLDNDFGEIPNAKQRDAVQKMFISGNRLINLVENLLNISRIESGRIKFDFEPKQLTELAHEVYDTLKKSAEDAGLYLKFIEPKEKLPLVCMDDEKIRQVLLNFIDNAIKYTKAGGVTVSLERKKEEIVCKVTDTGMGVTAEDQVKLFKKFSRGKDSFLINTEGMGLGLYVANMMIAAHKGKIWIESEGIEGKGSKFCFSLPLAESAVGKRLVEEGKKEEEKREKEKKVHPVK